MRRLLLILVALHPLLQMPATPFTSDWQSIDSRPIPEWFTDAKFGIFIHWGVYSVPSFRSVSDQRYQSYAEWYYHSVLYDTVRGGRAFHVANFGENFEYRDFGPLFRAELWDPEYWAELFFRSGARYVVLTAKHHDGFCLWPTRSPYSRGWNSIDTGPGRDLVGELSNAVRARGLRMGLYYSLKEWESTPRSNGNHYLPSSIVDKHSIPQDQYIEQHMHFQLRELVDLYAPSVIFADGEWDHPSSFWRSTEFLSWLYNEASNRDEVVVNDRWGSETRGRHGGYHTSEYSSDSDTVSIAHPWEESRGVGQSYGYNRAENIDHYSSYEDLILELIQIVSRGGNLLLNVGPSADGRIPVYQQFILSQIGTWLKTNGQAIYGTTAWADAPDIPDVYFTRKDNDLYLIFSNQAVFPIAIDGLPNAPEAVTLIGYEAPVDYTIESGSVQLNAPLIPVQQHIRQPAHVIQLKKVFQ